MLGPYIKSRGTRGTEMLVNAELITVETYIYIQGETIWNPVCKKIGKLTDKSVSENTTTFRLVELKSGFFFLPL